MDPNVALANLRNMMNKARIFQTHVHAVAAREAFDALDGWLMRGGFYPQDWEDAKARDLAAVRTALARKVPECSCHIERLASHDACCGHDDGRDPNCPFHGDGSWV